MTTESLPLLRWTPQEFADAFDNGVFGDRRVQLVDGMVWDMAGMQGWHGAAVFRIAGLLAEGGVVVTAQTLPMPDSLPDPDVWLRRKGAEPTGYVGTFETWDPADVLLVVEVSDTTRAADLGVKARMYARGGVEHYLVVTKTGVHVFSEPRGESLGGYAEMAFLGYDDSLVLPYGQRRTVKVFDLTG